MSDPLERLLMTAPEYEAHLWSWANEATDALDASQARVVALEHELERERYFGAERTRNQYRHAVHRFDQLWVAVDRVARMGERLSQQLIADEPLPGVPPLPEDGQCYPSHPACARRISR